jgi:chromate reductase
MPNDARRTVHVLVFGASLRQGSLNNQLATSAARALERTVTAVDLATMAEFDCPAYNQEIETTRGVPDGAQELCRRLKRADAFVIASPEYNASMPGYLKNSIDWVSRFRPQPLNGRQGLLLSASPSMVGGNRGLWALRVPCEHLGARIYPDMFSLAQAHTAFAPDGQIADLTLRKRFEDTLKCFVDLVEAAKHYPQLKKQWVEFLGERPNAVIDRVETSEVVAG